jgi:hypothetical protein
MGKKWIEDATQPHGFRLALIVSTRADRYAQSACKERI